MSLNIQYAMLSLTTIYHLFCSLREKNNYPGELIPVCDRSIFWHNQHRNIHLYTKGEGTNTIILDHSLGGVEGYFLIDSLAKIGKVCIYDRPGYGWSEESKKTRCSKEIVKDLDTLLTNTNIEPPYILIGDSFGSYNVRLYAHLFPEKVAGIVLTDGLHEQAMLNMPKSLVALKFFFWSGFIMSIFGSLFGIIRILGMLGTFELLNPELKQFPQYIRQQVKQSFYNHNHWLTMAREIWHLDVSGEQLKIANYLGNLPIVSIKSQNFFKPSFLNFIFPLKTADKLRDKIHQDLSQLSTNYLQINGDGSSHFVWIDRPDIIVDAVKIIIDIISK